MLDVNCKHTQKGSEEDIIWGVAVSIRTRCVPVTSRTPSLGQLVTQNFPFDALTDILDWQKMNRGQNSGSLCLDAAHPRYQDTTLNPFVSYYPPFNHLKQSSSTYISRSALKSDVHPTVQYECRNMMTIPSSTHSVPRITPIFHRWRCTVKHDP